MENNRRIINFYAALAISIIVTIIIALAVFVIGVILTAQTSTTSSDSEYAVFIATAAILLLASLFFGLPAILNSRYGWKTVVVTFIFQSVFVFGAVTAIAAIANPGQSGTSPSPVYHNQPLRGLD